MKGRVFLSIASRGLTTPRGPQRSVTLGHRRGRWKSDELLIERNEALLTFSRLCPVCWGPCEPLHHPDRSSAQGCVRVCAVECVMFCESMMDGLAGG